MNNSLPRIALATFMACACNSAVAQDTDTVEVREMLAHMQELHSSLHGMTITMTGAIGTTIGDLLYFKNDDGRFQVQFDAGSSARKSIEGCELEWFGWANSNCIVEVDAEIAVTTEYNFADGGAIKLIVYEVRR